MTTITGFGAITYGADTAAHPPLAECVRHRAYELFEARGRNPGQDLDDWLQAEHEVLGHFGFPSGLHRA